MFGMAPYLVKITDEHKQPVNLFDFFAKNSLKSFLDDYYKSHLNKEITTPENKKTFLVSQICKGSNFSVAGTYETGEFGFKSRIYSTGKKITAHHRLTDEADMHPFYFAYYFMENAPMSQQVRGLLLLSRFKTLGVRSMTIPHLQQHFNKSFPRFKLDISRMLPPTILETLMKSGSLKTIRLIRNTLPKDIADKFTQQDESRIHEVEMVIQTKRNMVFSDVQWLWDAIKAKKNPHEIITVDSFQPNNIKLDIKIGNKLRVLDLRNPGRLSSNIDVSDLVPDTNGHPKLEEWLGRADELAADITSSWGVENLAWNTKI